VLGLPGLRNFEATGADMADLGMTIAAPPWSGTRNEACRLRADLSIVDSLRLAVQNNSIVVSSAAR
jgi:hypothetical protein